MSSESFRGPRAVQCDGKAVFGSWSQASRRIRIWRLHRRQYGDTVPHPYRCPHCGGYHIGNTPKRRLSSAPAQWNDNDCD